MRNHLIRLPLLPHQRAVLALDAHVKALVGGFGCGKTYTMACRALDFCSQNPGRYGAIVSPSLPLAKRSVIPVMHELLKQTHVPYQFNHSGSAFDILGARIWIMSGHDPETLKGPTLGWCGIDEPFIQDKKVYEYMLARLRAKGSTMIEMLLTGTPEQLNWGYDILVKDPAPFAKYIKAKSKDNPYMPKVTLDAMDAAYSDEMRRAYCDGEFVVLNSRMAYYSFSDRNVCNLPYTPGLPLVLTCDFNRAPMCWNVLQEPRDVSLGTVTHVLDEIHVDGTNTYECLDVFVQRWRQRHHGTVIVGGDYTGSSYRDTVTTITNYEAILDRLRGEWGPANVELQIRPNPSVQTRVNLVNAELRNSRGEHRLLFDRSCLHTLDDYRLARFKEGTQTINKAARDPHHADAVDYRVFYRISTEGQRQGRTVRRAV